MLEVSVYNLEQCADGLTRSSVDCGRQILYKTTVRSTGLVDMARRDVSLDFTAGFQRHNSRIVDQ
jgi:hypothetical protein